MAGIDEVIDLFTLNINDQPALDAIDNLIQVIDALGADTQTALDIVSAAFDRGLLSLDQFAQAWVQVGDFASTAAQQVDDATSAIDTGIQSADEAVLALVQAFHDGGMSIEEFVQKFQDLETQFGNLRLVLSETITNTSDLISVFDALNATTQTTDDVVGRLLTRFADLGLTTTQTMDALTQAFDSGLLSIDQYQQALDTLAQRELTLAPSTTTVDQALSDQAVALQAAGQSAADYTAMLAGMGGALEAADVSMGIFDEGMVLASVDMDAAATSMSLLDEAILTVGDAMGALGFSEDAVVTATGLMDEAVSAASTAWATLSSVLDTVGGALATVRDAMFGTTAAADEETVADTTKTDALMALQMQLMLVAMMLGMAAVQFVSMGEAAQTQLAYVQGLALGTTTSISQFLPTLEGYATTYGVTLDKVAQGFYYIISSGYPAADATQLLGAAMMASAASGASLSAVSSALTSVMRSYNDSASMAQTVTDQMTMAVIAGKQTYQEFSAAIGVAAVTGAALGLSFDQVSAAEATMTQSGLDAHRSVMDLDFMLRATLTSTDAVATKAKAMGLSFDAATYNSDSLIQKLEYLHQISGGNEADFIKLVGGANGFLAAQILLTNHGQNYIDILNKIDHSSGATASAFQVAEQTMQAASDRLTAALSVLAYQFVVLITPILAPLMTAVSDALKALAANAQVAVPVFAALAVIVGAILVGAIYALLAPLLEVAGPFLLIAAAVGALVGVVIALIDPIRTFFASISNTSAFIVLGDLLSTIASLLRGTFSSALQGAGAIFQQVAGWFASHAGDFRQLALNLIAIADEILVRVIPALVGLQSNLAPVGSFIMGTVVPAIGQLASFLLHAAVTATGNFMPAFALIDTVLRIVGQIFTAIGSEIASVFGPAIQQIGGMIQSQVIPAFTMLWSSIQPLTPEFLMLAQGIGIVAAIIAGVLVGVLNGILHAVAFLLVGVMLIVTGIIQIFTGLIAFVAGFIALLVDLFTGNFGRIGNDLTAMFNGIAMIISGLLMAIAGLFYGVFGAIYGFVVGFVTGIIGFFQFLYHAIVGGSIIPDLVNGIINWFNMLVSMGVAVIDAFMSAIIAIFTALESGVVAVVTALYTGVVALITMLYTGTIAIFTALSTGVQTIWNAFSTTVVAIAQTLITNVINAFQTVIALAAGVFNNMVSTVTGILNNLAGQMFSIGVNIVQGIINGIGSMIGAVGQAASNVAQAISSFLPHSPAEQGPLMHADTFMPNFVTMLAGGLDQGAATLAAASLHLASQISAPHVALSASTPGSSSASGGGVGSQAHILLLQQILAVLQAQGRGGGNTSNTTITNQHGVQNLPGLYQAQNILAGYAYEFGQRGASAGLF